jgi:hypothetical protein
MNYHRRWKFSNGYGVSVIRNDISLGHKEGLYEIAVLRGNALCYNTPITEGIVGYLTPREVVVIIRQVKELPSP